MAGPRPLVLLAACAVVAAGCGGSSSDDRGSATTTTSTPGPAGVRSAEHDAREQPAIELEPQGTEPNKGTPGANDAIGGKVDIPIRGRRFTQPVMRLKVGQIVVFTNDDDVPHTVRAIGAALPHSGLIPVGGRFEFTPLRPARVRYRCVLHRGMTGRLIVSAT